MLIKKKYAIKKDDPKILELANYANKNNLYIYFGFSEKDEKEYLYLIEYHNEKAKRIRAADKVFKYNAAKSSEAIWADGWQTNTFPPILAVFRDLYSGSAPSSQT